MKVFAKIVEGGLRKLVKVNYRQIGYWSGRSVITAPSIHHEVAQRKARGYIVFSLTKSREKLLNVRYKEVRE